LAVLAVTATRVGLLVSLRGQYCDVCIRALLVLVDIQEYRERVCGFAEVPSARVNVEVLAPRGPVQRLLRLSQRCLGGVAWLSLFTATHSGEPGS
jgi:hypothetical protein